MVGTVVEGVRFRYPGRLRLGAGELRSSVVQYGRGVKFNGAKGQGPQRCAEHRGERPL